MGIRYRRISSWRKNSIVEKAQIFYNSGTHKMDCLQKKNKATKSDNESKLKAKTWVFNFTVAVHSVLLAVKHYKLQKCF